MSVRRALALLPLLFSSGAVAAQDAEEPLDAGARDELTVTANRVEQNAAEVAGSLTLFTRDDIESSTATTLDEFLRRVPGFSLFRRSSSVVAHPTTQGVSLRGIAPSGVSRALVLVDGMPANDAFGGWVYWSRIPLEDVERVEVLRGGGSNVWGNYALSGVINVTTRPIEAGRLAAAAEIGDRNDLELDLHGSRRGERHGWSLGGNHFRTDGHHVVREDQRGPIDVEAFSERLYASSKLEWEPSRRTSVSARLFHFDEDRGNGTPLTHNDTDSLGVDLTVARATTGSGSLEMALFGRDQGFASTFSAQAPDRGSERPALDQFDVASAELGAGVQWTGVAGERHLLAAGSDLRWIDGQTRELFFWQGESFLRERRAGGEQRTAGLFVQDLLSLSADLQLTLSARVDAWSNTDGQRLETERADGTVRRDDRFPDRDETALSPKLAVRYRANDRLALRGSLYRSFRAPTINELYRPFRVRNDITEANAELRPESLTGAEVGLDVLPGRVSARVTVFWNEVSDPIANVTVANAEAAGVIAPCGFVPAGGSCRQRRNLGSTLIVGLEGGMEFRPTEAWALGAAYLYSEGEVVDAPLSLELEGKRLAQVPEHQLTLTLGWQSPRRLRAHLEARYLSEQFEDDANSRVLDPVVVVDLSFGKRVSPGLEVLVRVQNLFDETYEVGESADGLVTIGTPRAIFLGARFSAEP